MKRWSRVGPRCGLEKGGGGSTAMATEKKHRKNEWGKGKKKNYPG